MLKGTYQLFFKEISGRIDPSRIFSDPIRTLAYGTDASFYRLIPKIVIQALDENEVSFLLKTASKYQLPITFRAAGTSLSGQAISDSILIIAGEHWRNYKIIENGEKIKLQPGLRGGKVNNLLAPYQRKIGPDPASIQTAMIGGIAVNNASGMCCGTHDNSYKTVNGMRIILVDGTVLDTCDSTSKQEFQKSHPDFIEKILQLGKKVKENTNLYQRIQHKFKIKNTTGYSINALADYTDPFEIIEHLMIGSEGTLGFISEITYRTVRENPFKASAFILFQNPEKACEAVILLKSSPVSAVELIDRSGIRSVENEKGIPSEFLSLDEECCALLVETQAQTIDELNQQIEKIKLVIQEFSTVLPYDFTSIPAEYALFWKIRKGLLPAVGATRKPGTTVIIEDVAFPIEKLANAIHDLSTLLKEYQYHEAVIFGHALDGNLHFVFTQDFNLPNEVKRYENFMMAITKLVVEKYDGSLKAEHGTGRNMAPFVEKEWGKEAFSLMQEIKLIFDPQLLLNPGVILNNDPSIHLKNLKPLPQTNHLIDTCMECGFCEPYCVSSGLTLSARQRIVVYRELKSNQFQKKYKITKKFRKAYNYLSNETCATDGLCGLACPVKIDTGALIKEWRFDHHTKTQNWTAEWMANHMTRVTRMGRWSLKTVNRIHLWLGTKWMESLSGKIRQYSFQRLPFWNSNMPSGASATWLKSNQVSKIKKVVYFPSCINRTMGMAKETHPDVQLTEKTSQLLKKAGYEILYPENLDELCCGMAFLSKGFNEAGEKKSTQLEASLLKISEDGKYPVLCDMSPCLYTMKKQFKSDLKLYEPVEFILKYLLQELFITPIEEPISVYSVCSMKKMGIDHLLLELAKKCANEVVEVDSNCCGFAGDRGFTYPELNAYGHRNLKIQLSDRIKKGYSTSRTCEIGLTYHSGITYKSIIYLVDQVSQPLKV